MQEIAGYGPASARARTALGWYRPGMQREEMKGTTTCEKHTVVWTVHEASRQGTVGGTA